MSFLSKSAAEKGSPLSVTLSKDDLASLPSLSSDAYFSDIANWMMVSILYKNAEGQSKTIVFDANHANPNTVFKSSAKARSGFQIESVTIFDFDGGFKTFSRIQLIADSIDLGALDVTFGPVTAAITGFQAVISAVDEVTFSWDAYPGADEYYIYYSVDGGTTFDQFLTGSTTANTTLTTFQVDPVLRYYKVATFNSATSVETLSSAIALKGLKSGNQLYAGFSTDSGTISAVTANSLNLTLLTDGTDGADTYALSWGYSNSNFTVGSLTRSAGDESTPPETISLTGLTGSLYIKLVGSNAYGSITKISGPIALAAGEPASPMIYQSDLSTSSPLDANEQASGPATMGADGLLLGFDGTTGPGTLDVTIDAPGTGVSFLTEYTARVWFAAVNGACELSLSLGTVGYDITNTEILNSIANDTPVSRVLIPEFSVIDGKVLELQCSPDVSISETVTIKRVELEITANAGSLTIPGLPLVMDFSADPATMPAYTLFNGLAVAGGMLEVTAAGGGEIDINELRRFIDTTTTSEVNIRLYTTDVAEATPQFMNVNYCGAGGVFFRYDSVGGFYEWGVTGANPASHQMFINIDDAVFPVGTKFSKIEILSYSAPSLGAFPSDPVASAGTDASTEMSLTFPDVTNAVHYDGFYGTSPGDVSIQAFDDWTAGGTANITGLTPNTTYYFKVVAFTAGDASSVESNVVSGTTAAPAPMFTFTRNFTDPSVAPEDLTAASGFPAVPVTQANGNLRFEVTDEGTFPKYLMDFTEYPGAEYVNDAATGHTHWQITLDITTWSPVNGDGLTVMFGSPGYAQFDEAGASITGPGTYTLPIGLHWWDSDMNFIIQVMNGSAGSVFEIGSYTLTQVSA